MPKVVVINYQLMRDEIASVHKEGCRDIPRNIQDNWGVQYGPFDSVEEALSDYIDSEMEEMGWTREDVKVFPCCYR